MLAMICITTRTGIAGAERDWVVMNLRSFARVRLRIPPSLFLPFLALASVLALPASATSAELGLWTFEEYSGQSLVPANGIITDTSGSNRHMFALGGKTVTAGELPGSTALEFSGTLRDLLEFEPGFSNFSNADPNVVASASDIVFGGLDSYTIEVKVTLPHDNYYGLEGRIIGRGQWQPGVQDEWGIVAINDSNNLPNRVEGFLGDGTNSFFRKPTADNVTTGWRHVALVRDRSTDMVHLYIDGSLIQSQSDSGNWIDLSQAGGNLMVGGTKHHPVKPFRGSIDMIRISDTALDPNDFYNGAAAVSSVPSVPEPAGMVLVVAGLVCLLGGRKR